MSRKIRTYLDSSVLIQAVAGRGPVSLLAQRVLDDPNRIFLTSAFVEVECLPSARYHRDAAQEAFMATYLATAERVKDEAAILEQAMREGAATGAAGIDACHLAAAVRGGADELVTAEKPTKPMCRSRSVVVASIRW